MLYNLIMARDWYIGKSYAPDNLEEFLRHKQGTPAVTYKIIPTLIYEPFFIGYKPDLPHYWEGFKGFGLNKQSFTRECFLSGFELEGQYKLYLTHLAHYSNVNRRMRNFNARNWDEEFAPYLKSKYPEVPQTLKSLHRRDKSAQWYQVPP